MKQTTQQQKNWKFVLEKELEICELEEKPIEVDVEDKFLLLEKEQATEKENLLLL